ncbi:MAG: Cys-Xaa-Xaa-Xaa repeat radical SAM target protein [Candidatus Omnitrophota bacterium]
MEEKDSVKNGSLGEKQERREFLKSFGKIALPAIAILGFGALKGSQVFGESRSKSSKSCEKNCSGDCDGSCKGECGNNCTGDCTNTCKGDCNVTCKGENK